MKPVDFYKLPRAIQDRFVGSVMSGFPPAPVLATKGGTPLKLAWIALSVASFLLVAVVTRIGYGSLESALALHSAKALVLYVALVFGGVFGIVQAVGLSTRERALPYAAGIYLFPACLIDARSDQFKVYSTHDLQTVDTQGAAVRVVFGGGRTFLFACADPSRAAAIVAEVQTGRDRAMHARATEDPKELVAADPLHNPRFSSPVGPRDPHALRRPPWRQFGWALALLVAVIVAPTLWLARNSGSDRTMYARATQANDTASYRAYLERGTKFKDEVGNVLLPRAELRDAERTGTVEALVDYRTKHPSSKIATEVAASIRGAMLGELEKAKAVGTLAALDEFGKKFPDHGVDAELKDAVHAIYVRDLEAYKKRAPQPPKDKNAVPFVERLFAWAEKNGPRVELRFRRKKNESMGRADQYVAKTPSFMGEVSYPSRQFDDRHGTKREGVLAKLLATRLDAGLSPELFDVQQGAQIPVDTDVLPDVKVPTLFVTHSAEWSGLTYVSTKPRGSYVGVGFPFEAVFVIPGDAKPLKLKWETSKQAPLHVLKEEDLLPGPAEEKVYETMASEAFDQFGGKVLGLFFAKEPAAK
ncbi:MAG: hypothetical protein JWP97_2656 [Labilithrix sp.]|nr:hypothetical protein [Labilithrix sp.]